MKTYYVMTPEYGLVDRLLDDGTGPTEYGRDVATLKAHTKAEARRLGYKQLKTKPWFRNFYEQDKHPYAYLTIEVGDDYD